MYRIAHITKENVAHSLVNMKDTGRRTDVCLLRALEDEDYIKERMKKGYI